MRSPTKWITLTAALGDRANVYRAGESKPQLRMMRSREELIATGSSDKVTWSAVCSMKTCGRVVGNHTSWQQFFSLRSVGLCLNLSGCLSVSVCLPLSLFVSVCNPPPPSLSLSHSLTHVSLSVLLSVGLSPSLSPPWAPPSLSPF